MALLVLLYPEDLQFKTEPEATRFFGRTSKGTPAFYKGRCYKHLKASRGCAGQNGKRSNISWSDLCSSYLDPHMS